MILLRFLRSLRTLSRVSFRHKGSFKNNDTTVETDEVVSDNNPWSPTLYQDKVYVRQGWKNVALPSKFRLSYEPLYESPGAKYVAILKRLTLSFAVLGVYGLKLLYELVQFDDIFALGVILGTWTPVAAVQYKTKDYVTRIFRLYDKEKPHTLENLVNDEQLIVEKLNATGGKTYNTLVTVLGNESLKLCTGEEDALKPYRTWQETVDGRKKFYYIMDNLGGMKMDRLWGIVEHNLGVDNGRYMEQKRDN
ncbi:hypothetical protein METBIDRAFT_46149 [Metschnikowia bicuspidata var. bicuspidata NRRL YB-4993]|uniref:Uncharacterized protein n=1 Tax=Metschnikowia bicuspidata var. bicuspidata NRRL YB-4993 TaxID=869754 RepID=A0A1A0H6Q2_9ASCO|nr:hypothetical protein METBIDRAFT_46149 [Metschnikowia bicuspidata var. bicuspidata NRRL YB-4993]OBA19587.1 hypothetical protein METBIDRAFT_46149 [Metschnikowia bicuspidata var. bicuspidata NRRL YB-4993]